MWKTCALSPPLCVNRGARLLLTAADEGVTFDVPYDLLSWVDYTKKLAARLRADSVATQTRLSNSARAPIALVLSKHCNGLTTASLTTTSTVSQGQLSSELSGSSHRAHTRRAL
jgi:hypothetical protein